MSTDVTDESLLGALSGPYGDEAREALAELYRRHAPHVLGLLGRFQGLDGAAVDDCVQETFLVVKRFAGQFQRGSVRAWLLAIAIRRVKDQRRADVRRARREQVAASRRPEAREDTAQGERGVAELLEALGERQRVVLELRFIQGLTLAEAAGVLGVSLRTVKAWSRQALDELRLFADAWESDRSASKRAIEEEFREVQV